MTDRETYIAAMAKWDRTLEAHKPDRVTYAEYLVMAPIADRAMEITLDVAEGKVSCQDAVPLLDALRQAFLCIPAANQPQHAYAQ